jgi:hypothetical protein
VGIGLGGAFTIYAAARSSQALAAHVSDGPLVTFETFRMSLPFYLRRPVPLASRTARAFTSNYLLTKPVDALRPQLLSQAMLRAALAGPNPPFVITSRTQVAALRTLSPLPLEIVYTDRVSALLRPKS